MDVQIWMVLCVVLCIHEGMRACTGVQGVSVREVGVIGVILDK